VRSGKGGERIGKTFQLECGEDHETNDKTKVKEKAEREGEG
jgi:hypothetical protein